MKKDGKLTCSYLHFSFLFSMPSDVIVACTCEDEQTVIYMLQGVTILSPYFLLFKRNLLHFLYPCV